MEENHIGGVMVIMLALSVVDCELELELDHTKDNAIGIFCFPTTDAALRRERENKDWLARNQDNVSEWSDTSTHKLLFQ